MHPTQKTDPSKKISIVFLSTSWAFNPYQALLISHLKEKGLEVTVSAPSLFLVHRFLFNRPDIIHVQFVQHFLSNSVIYGWLRFLLFTVQVLMMKLLGVSVVWTVHEWTDKLTDKGNYSISPLKAKILGIILAAAITHCDSSNHTIVKVSGLGPVKAKKIFTIPHHHYIDIYPNNIEREAARAQLGLSDSSTVFLYFGSIHRSKGILEAIEAFSAVDDDLAKFIIAGQPSDEMRSHILEKISTCKNVLFVDPPHHIPEDDIQVYMNASDIVVLPYKIFTASGVAVLAMSFKKTCIAPNSGFFKDILDPAGAFLYDPAAEDALIKAIKLAIAHRGKLSQMGKTNFEKAQSWNWDYITAKTIEVYQFALKLN